MTDFSVNSVGHNNQNIQQVGFNPFNGSKTSGGVSQGQVGPEQHLDQDMLQMKKDGFDVGCGGTNYPVDANGKIPTICYKA